MSHSGKKRKRAVTTKGGREHQVKQPPPDAALLNNSLANRLYVKNELGLDAFEYYANDMRKDFSSLANCVGFLEERLDPEFKPFDDKHVVDPQYVNEVEQLREIQHRIDKEHAAALRRHTNLRDAIKPTTPLAALQYVRTSWTLLCRYALVRQQIRDIFEFNRSYEEIPRCLLSRAMDFEYVRSVTNEHCVIGLSDLEIGEYSLNLLMTSTALFCEALDQYGWSETAGEYLRALYMRYALFIHNPAQCMGDPVDLGEWESPFPSKETGEPMLAPAPVRTAIIDVGERLFFHHIWRSHSASELWQCNTMGSLTTPLHLDIHQARATWRLTRALPAFGQMISKLLQHEALAQTVRDRFAIMYPSRLVWPGQREQLMREYPLEASDARPDAILFRLRIADYKALQRMEKHGDVAQSIEAYIQQEITLAERMLALTPDDIRLDGNTEDGDTDALTENHWIDRNLVVQRRGFDMEKLVDPERVALLLFEIAFELRYPEVTRMQGMKYFVQHAYVDDRTLEPAANARPCYSRKELRRARAEAHWPLFVAVWQTYCVASPLKEKAMRDTLAANTVYTTGHLLDALGLWLTLAARAPVSGTMLNQWQFFDDSDWDQMKMPIELAHLPPI